MKRIEEVYREILYQAMEKKNRRLTQKELSIKLGLSLSIVSLALKSLRRMNAIKINNRSLDIINIRKILLYWASIRNLEKDILCTVRLDKNVREIEKDMKHDFIFTAFSGYKFKFNEVPADYSEVYTYGNELIESKYKDNPNLIILKKDKNMGLYKEITLAQLFVDLWNLNQWYAKDYLDALEEKLNGILA